jgi:ketosteroid isomerase-like protein
MTETITSDLHDLLAAWAAAETRGDAAALAPLLVEDFTALGPLGFTLTRPEWLTRFDNGLDYTSVTVDDPQIRVAGDPAMVTARQSAVGTYRGHPVPQAVRTTIVLGRAAGHGQLVRLPMSFVAGTRLGHADVGGGGGDDAVGAGEVPGRPQRG